MGTIFIKKILLSIIFIFVTTSIVNAQLSFTIGSNTGSNINTNYPCAIPDYYEGNRSQYLYLASEMQSMGMAAGTISSIKFNVTALNNFSGDIGQYSISIANTPTTSLSLTSWESMFQSSTFGPVDYVPTLGLNEFILSTPFHWNGIDNIVVDICNGRPGNDTMQDYSYNISTAWTTNLGFNASHTYRANNLGNLCSTTNVQNLAKTTTRPDITFLFTYSNACNGASAGGTTVSSKDTVCANDGINLFTSGSSIGSGLTYQWQKSIDNINYDSIPGANSFSCNLPNGIGVGTYFRRKTTCSGSSSFSSAVFVYVRPFYECYCSPKTNVGLYINSTISIDSITVVGASTNYKNVHIGYNPAPSFAYAAFTDTTAATILTMQQAETYKLSIATSARPSAAAVWIDWNHNGLFDSAEYKLISFPTDSTYADTTIEIPSNATLGLTMMRIRISTLAFNYSNACTLFNDGETEDYLFKVVAGTACSGTPVGGSAISSVNTICPNKPFYLTVAGATDGVVVSYQWQSSNNCGNTFSDIIGATDKALYIYGITTNTAYRRKIICGTNSSYSSVVCVTMNPLYDCFCSPLNGNTLQYSTNPPPSNPSIDNVAITDNGVLYSNANVGFNVSPYAYSINDDTALAPNLAQAVAYTLTISTNIYPRAVGVWIDWNANGIYEASEYVPVKGYLPPPISSTSASIIITPPTNVLGFIGMRVRSNSAFLTTEACRAWTSGETEDYVLKIIPGTPCSGTPVGGVTESKLSIVCHYDSIFLSTTNASENLIGLTYQWQDSAVGGLWTNKNLQTVLNDTTSQVVAKYYRRQITCANSNLSDYSIPVFVDLNAPTYAAIPFTESFETTWDDGCGNTNSRSIPNNSWRNNPKTSNQSWRRDDDGASANWTTNSFSAYTPTATDGNHSARFHTSQAQGFPEGNLDLFLDCSATTSLKNLSFDYINLNGNDSLRIYLSTDAGLTFTKIAKYALSAGWTNETISFNSNTTTTVIRFKVSPDFGVSDIGIDNISVTNNPLPITSLNLQGERKGTVNKLAWTTATETNNLGFELLRSNSTINGDFAKIGFVASKVANGNSSNILAYSFDDENASLNNTYYKLKQVDKNGKFSFSNTILIKPLKAATIEILSVYPNPVADKFNITIASPTNNRASIVIADIYGKIVMHQNVDLVAGSNIEIISLNKLAAGTYTIKLVCENGCESVMRKFVKL